jgi:hypothetical protein
MVDTNKHEGSLSPALRVSDTELLKRTMAASPNTVSPQLARSLQATENAWRTVAAEFGLLTSGQVDSLLGAKPSNRNLASRHRAARQLAGVTRGNIVLYPGFQFERSRRWVLPLMEVLVHLADTNGWREEDLLLWLCSPTTTFDVEDRPVDHLDQPDAVVAAARIHLEYEF